MLTSQTNNLDNTYFTGSVSDFDDLDNVCLQDVLRALRALQDIAGLCDDKARRKAVSRIALGLMYGLDV